MRPTGIRVLQSAKLAFKCGLTDLEMEHFVAHSHSVQLTQRRYIRPLVICARRPPAIVLRVGLSILIEAYPYVDARRTERAEFIWFMNSTDPKVCKPDWA